MLGINPFDDYSVRHGYHELFVCSPANLSVSVVMDDSSLAH